MKFTITLYTEYCATCKVQYTVYTNHVHSAWTQLSFCIHGPYLQAPVYTPHMPAANTQFLTFPDTQLTPYQVL